jgi:hypothetical protein
MRARCPNSSRPAPRHVRHLCDCSASDTCRKPYAGNSARADITERQASCLQFGRLPTLAMLDRKQNYMSIGAVVFAGLAPCAMLPLQS